MKRSLAILLISLCLFSITLAPSNANAPLSLIYLSPAPGAHDISPTTSLAIRQGSPLDAGQAKPDLFSVVGSHSGAHSGTVRLSDDDLTLLYYPSKPFAYDETVTVVVKPGLTTVSGNAIAGTSYQFYTLDRPLADLAVPEQGDGYSYALPQGEAPLAATPRYHTYPAFSNVMTTTVTTAAHNTGDGYIFVAGMGIIYSSDPSLLIVDNKGEPIYIQRTSSGMVTTDFKRQIVKGVPYLTYYVGAATNAWANGTYYVMDQSYSVVDSWTIGNGYGADLHEMQLLNNGHAILESYTPIPVDLSPYGGPADGVVMDSVIQEQDTAKNVIFEWHGSQHVPLTDTYASLTQSPVDFMHTNAIEVDHDGNLLVSNRHLAQVLKINRQTGNVIWRLGGRSNQFTFTNDAGFSFQHDIRRLPDGHITLFDNGNQRVPPYSRGVEYELDEVSKTITRTWEFVNSPTSYAAYMGDVQRLSNGNSVIGWGAVPQVTEVLPDGSKAFEMALGALSYRAFRFTWDALPAELPHLAVVYGSDPTAATVYSSWNGATQISAYEIYAGLTVDTMSLITTTVRTGFETAAPLTGLDPATCVFTIRPVHQQAVVTPFSANFYRLDQPHCRELLNFRYLPFVLK